MREPGKQKLHSGKTARGTTYYFYKKPTGFATKLRTKLRKIKKSTIDHGIARVKAKIEKIRTKR